MGSMFLSFIIYAGGLDFIKKNHCFPLYSSVIVVNVIFMRFLYYFQIKMNLFTEIFLSKFFYKKILNRISRKALVNKSLLRFSTL